MGRNDVRSDSGGEVARGGVTGGEVAASSISGATTSTGTVVPLHSKTCPSPQIGLSRR
jgi:hypothetical protein